MNDPGFMNTPRDQRNSRRYTWMSALWALVYVTSTFVLAFDLVEPVPLRWVLVFLPSVFAVFWVRSYWRYMSGMDELLRAIELKALALAVAAGSVVWPAMELLDNGMDIDVDVPVVLLVMTGFYCYGVIKGRTALLS